MKLLQVALLFTFVMLVTHVAAYNLRTRRDVYVGGTSCVVDSDCPMDAPFCTLVNEIPLQHVCLTEEGKKKEDKLHIQGIQWNTKFFY